MKTFIALLRGINVSGQKKIKMADLRAMLEKMPFQDVQTYIQSGNIVLKSAEKEIALIETEINKMLAKTFGYEVPVLVKSKEEFEQIIKGNPYTAKADLEAKKIYFALLKSAPNATAVAGLDQAQYPHELFQIAKNCVYLNCTKGAGKAKLNNNIIERKLKVVATTRNYRTMTKLLELASS